MLMSDTQTLANLLSDLALDETAPAWVRELAAAEAGIEDRSTPGKRRIRVWLLDPKQREKRLPLRYALAGPQLSHSDIARRPGRR
jgi:hypothetical protein